MADDSNCHVGIEGEEEEEGSKCRAGGIPALRKKSFSMRQIEKSGGIKMKGIELKRV